MLKTLDDIIELAKGKNKIIAIAGGEDKEAIKAVHEAKDLGVSAILFGKKKSLKKT